MCVFTRVRDFPEGYREDEERWHRKLVWQTQHLSFDSLPCCSAAISPPRDLIPVLSKRDGASLTFC